MAITTLLPQPTLALAWQLASADATTTVLLPSIFQLAVATTSDRPVAVTVVHQ